MAETKERPILFSAPMIRAILDGQKTQTRRVVKPQPSSVKYLGPGGALAPFKQAAPPRDMPNAIMEVPIACPYGAPGDRLWVRESHQRFDKGSCDQHVWYTAGRNDNSYVARTRPEIDQDAPWPRDAAGPAGGAVYGVPSIHMPRWASRILLEIVSVRVERLHAISEDDARSEGVEPPSAGRDEHDWKVCPQCGGTGLHGALGANLGYMEVDCVDCDTHAKRFRHLWSSINGAESWDINPFVWVVEFKRVQP